MNSLSMIHENNHHAVPNNQATKVAMHAQFAEVNDAILARIHVLLLPLLILPLLDDFEARSVDLENRESVLFIGTQFSNLYTAVDTSANGRVGVCGIYNPGRAGLHGGEDCFRHLTRREDGEKMWSKTKIALGNGIHYSVDQVQVEWPGGIVFFNSDEHFLGTNISFHNLQHQPALLDNIPSRRPHGINKT
jgi:hypothetical protein